MHLPMEEAPYFPSEEAPRAHMEQYCIVKCDCSIQEVFDEIVQQLCFEPVLPEDDRTNVKTFVFHDGKVTLIFEPKKMDHDGLYHYYPDGNPVRGANGPICDPTIVIQCKPV